MSLQSSFTFYAKNINVLTWNVTDTSGVVVNSATVTASLYWNRDPIDPDVNPGELVTDFNNVNLPFDAVDQNYQASIPATFDPPVGGNYTLVVDASQGATGLGHWERRAVVVESP